MALVDNAANPAGMAAWQALVGTGSPHVSLTGANLPQANAEAPNWFARLGSAYAASNKSAFDNLFTSIHAAHPGQSPAVRALLEGDRDAGRPLTARLVERAINMATNSAAQLCDKWNDKANRLNLSPRKTDGNPLVGDFNTLFTNRYIAAPGIGDAVKVQVLTDMINEITNAPSVDAPVKERLLAYAEAMRSRIQFGIDAPTSPHACIRGLNNPADACWKMVMDQQHHARGSNYFENERGYMRGMLNGLNAMLASVGQPLTADLYRDLHDAACTGVQKHDHVGGGGAFELGYRDGAVRFGLETGFRASITDEGKAEFIAAGKNGNGWISLDETGPFPRVVTTSKTPAECRTKAADIIAQYQLDHAAAQLQPVGAVRDLAVMKAIAKCCQDLEQHHLFSDGNIRTVAMLTMNKLLIDNNLSPTVFKDPNAIDMLSIDQIVSLMQAGQILFATL